MLAVMKYRQQFTTGNDAELQRVAKRMVASHREFALRENHSRAMMASLFAIDLRALRTWERMTGRTATPEELEQFLRGPGGTFDFAALHLFPITHPVASFEELEDCYGGLPPRGGSADLPGRTRKVLVRHAFGRGNEAPELRKDPRTRRLHRGKKRPPSSQRLHRRRASGPLIQAVLPIHQSPPTCKTLAGTFL